VWTGSGEWTVLVDAKDGTQRRSLRLASRKLADARELSDGTLVVRASDFGTAMRGGIARVDARGALQWLIEGKTWPLLALAPSGGHVIARVAQEGDESVVVALPLAGGPPTPLDERVKPTGGLAFAPDRRSVVWSRCEGHYGCARVDASGKLVRVFAALGHEPDAIAWAAKGRKLVVLAEEGTEPGKLWVANIDHLDAARELPIGDLDAVSVATSPDGRRAVFASRKRGIHVVSLDGEGPPRALTTGASDGFPSFVADGKSVLFASRLEDGRERVAVVPLEGGEPRPLLPEDTTQPAASPVDGRIAYLAVPSNQLMEPMLFEPGKGSRPLSQKLEPGRYRTPVFSPDGARVAVLRGHNELVEVDAKTGAVTRLVRAGADKLAAFAYVDREIVVVRSEWRGHLWMAQGTF
jgi:Tol biopolymer transport system component